MNAEKSRQKSIESELHAFYQNQMESILEEKVKCLQNHVTDLESKLTSERHEEIASIKAQAKRDEDILRNKYILPARGRSRTGL